MKNFRKVLALILVVATLFSFVAMASAKTTADYADASEVKYVEAVDVLSTIGILKGYDGKYHPNDPIDRDEMAKMIAVLSNAGEDNADLFVGANTFADVKGSWAEGYVAYAAQVGIVNGRNATTFDPDAKVTGTEVLKMLLCTLGYNAKEQGYVGANWQVNVLRDAKKANLMDGLEGFNAYEPATRDEAAQMMFNALNAYMVVGYVSENIVDVSNSLYIALEDGDYAGISLKDADKAGWEIAYCNAVISNTALSAIFEDLIYVEGTEDCYGRPGHTWYFEKKDDDHVIGFYADAYNAKQTEGNFDEDELVYDKNDKVINVVVDGVPTAYADAEAGNGVLVEYYDDVTVVINTFIAKVGTVNEYYDYFTLVDNAGKKLGQYDLGDYELAEDDVVLFWPCGEDDGLHDVKVISGKSVEIAEGVNYKPDFDGWNASYVVAGGETYKYAAHLGMKLLEENSIDRMTFADVADDNKYDLYFDEYGFIKYYEETADAETEYSYTYIVEGSAASHNHGWTIDENGKKVETIDYVADMVNYGTDGTLSVTEDVATDVTVWNTLLDEEDKKYDEVGVLAKVFTDDDLISVEAIAEFAPAGTILDNEHFELADKAIYANSKTVFMIRTKDLKGDYTYEQVTGYKNLKGSYLAKDFADGKTNIQYFKDADHPAFASYVFIDAVYTKDFASTFITLGEADYYAFKTDLKELYADDYIAYTVLVGGEEAVVLVSNEEVGELKLVTKYDATVSYIGVAVTVDGKDLPIYKAVDLIKPENGDVAVGCHYVVADDEAYIWFEKNFGDIEAKEMYTVASDAVILTLTANKNDDDEWVTDVYEGILDLENDSKIEYCYVTIEDGVVTELIRVDVKFIENV